MTLLQTESFAAVGAADLNGKWTFASSYWETGTSFGRHSGASGGRTNQANTAELRQSVNDDLIIFGLGIRLPSLPGSGREVFATLRGDVNVTTHLTFAINANGAIEVWRGTTGGTLIAQTADAVVQANSAVQIQVKARLSDSTSDLAIRLNGASTNETLTPAGPYDTKNGGTATVFDNVLFHSGENGRAQLQDIFILDEADSGVSGKALNDFIGDIRVEEGIPSGGGNSNQFLHDDGSAGDANNYTEVDEITSDDDTSYVKSQVDNNKDLYAFPNLATAQGTVFGVMVYVKAKKSDTGARSLAIVARSGTNEADGADEALGTGYAWLKKAYVGKPDGGSNNTAWGGTNGVGDINAAEFGAKCRP